MGNPSPRSTFLPSYPRYFYIHDFLSSLLLIFTISSIWNESLSLSLLVSQRISLELRDELIRVREFNWVERGDRYGFR